jgi:hypothetical protein
LSQEENLQWAATLLEVAYDAQAKDITRVFFTTSAAQLLYLDDSIFASEEVIGTNFTNSWTSQAAKPSDHELKNNTSEDIVAGNNKIRVNSRNSCPKNFKGIAYADIIAEYWRRTGGVPTEGERNKRLHQLAANLRSISDSSSRPTTGNIGK